MFWKRKTENPVVAVIDGRKDNAVLAAAVTGLLVSDASMRQDLDKVAARTIAFTKAVEEQAAE